MRKECDTWRFCREGESAQESLARFFIGMDELRARLNPADYPNLEISDEGYIWFNVPSSLGNWEIFALPEGIDGLPGPALALSLPHNPRDAGKKFIEALCQTAFALPGMKVFAGYASTQEILEDYSENRQPRTNIAKGRDEILIMSDNLNFLSYCGLHFSVKTFDVSEVENMIRTVLSLVETGVRDLEERGRTF